MGHFPNPDTTILCICFVMLDYAQSYPLELLFVSFKYDQLMYRSLGLDPRGVLLTLANKKWPVESLRFAMYNHHGL